MEYPRVAKFWEKLTVAQRIALHLLNDERLYGNQIANGKDMAANILEFAEHVDSEDHMLCRGCFLFHLEKYLERHPDTTVKDVFLKLLREPLDIH